MNLQNWCFLGPWEEVLTNKLDYICKKAEIRSLENPQVHFGEVKIKKCFENALSGSLNPKMQAGLTVATFIHFFPVLTP